MMTSEPKVRHCDTRTHTHTHTHARTHTLERTDVQLVVKKFYCEQQPWQLESIVTFHDTAATVSEHKEHIQYTRLILGSH